MCKQHQAARAAERLVWLALILARSAMLGAVAPGEWPDDLPFSDDACTAQRDRLALGWDTKAFREVLAAYLQLQAIATTPPAERGDTVLFWPALARHDDRFRRPLAERLEETPHRHRAGARGRPAPRQAGLFDDEAFKQSAGGTLFYGKELVA